MNEKETLEGTVTGTSPENEQPQLNSTPVPTPEEEENAGLVPETEAQAEAEPELEPVMEEENGVISGPATITFTQSQVDEIVGKARKEARERFVKNLYERYGVNGEEELDNLFTDAQKYETLKDDYNAYRKDSEQKLSDSEAALTDVKERVALLESGIDKERYEDAKLILKGKGLDVSLENIESELATHPEWKKSAGLEAALAEEEPFAKTEEDIAKETKPATPPASLKVFGNPGKQQTPDEEPVSEYEKAMKLFKL